MPRLSLDSGFNSDENEINEDISCKDINYDEESGILN